MDWVGWVIGGLGLLVGGATLGVTIPALVLARRAEKRATERSLVEWYGEESPSGRLRISHQGVDTAYAVRIEAWDQHDATAVERDAMRTGDEVLLELPYRLAHGPDPVALPTRLTPRVPDEPPGEISFGGLEPPPAVRQMNAEERSRWEWMKKAQDAADASDAEMRRRFEAQQVMVRVMWRSEHGTWSSTTVHL